MSEDKSKFSDSTSIPPLSPVRPSSPVIESNVMRDSREKEGGGQKDRNAPPVAPQIMEKIFELDNVSIMDPYHWLRDINNPKVSKYLKDENAYASNAMKHTQHLQDTLYEEFVRRTQGDDQSPLLQVDDWFYYNRSEKEKQYLIHCRKFESPDAEEQIILDENEEAKGEDFFQLGPFEVSPNHTMLAYGIDTDGDEKFRIFCKDLTTGTMLDEDIWDAGWTLRWAADNVTFLYTKADKVTGRPYKVYCHTLKENSPDGSDDLELYHEPDERFVLKVNLTNNKKYFTLLIDGQVTKEVLYCSTATPKAGFQTILGRQQGVQYTASNHGNWWYIKTNEGGAYNFKVIKAAVSDPKNRELWEEVLPHREDVFIELIEVFRHHFVVWEWEGGVQKIRIQDLSDGEVHYINFTEPLYGVWPGEVEDQDDTLATRYFNTNRLRFSYSSFVQPTIIYDYDMDNCQKKKLKEEYIAGYSKSEYLQKRIWATAKDGAQIPISLVYKISLKNHEGGNPLLLTGYGAYGALSFPKFSVERLSLLDRGFIFAFAHVRGSAVLGWKWYEQGKLLNKINTFTDFIAAAEHLIAEGYTTPSQLAIYGRSAGGLLVTAVTNMRPDLFRVVLADVPFVDVIGAMIDPKVPWTVYEWEEWGNPREKEYFHYMLKYSPYHNIKRQNYPHILVTAGLNDSRVSYWEPAKYVAKLRGNTDCERHLPHAHKSSNNHQSTFPRRIYLFVD
jgi:oligopeptidase B